MTEHIKINDYEFDGVRVTINREYLTLLYNYATSFSLSIFHSVVFQTDSLIVDKDYAMFLYGIMEYLDIPVRKDRNEDWYELIHKIKAENHE